MMFGFKIPQCIAQSQFFFLIGKDILALWGMIHIGIVNFLGRKFSGNSCFYDFLEGHLFKLSVFRGWCSLFSVSDHCSLMIDYFSYMGNAYSRFGNNILVLNDIVR